MKFQEELGLGHAAEFITWWGVNDHCLSSTVEEVQAARAVITASPVVMERKGPSGPIRIHGLTIDGNVIWSNWRGESGQLPTSVGGWSQPVANYTIGSGPSRWVRGLYSGGCFCLSEADAAELGCTKRRLRRDSPDVEAAFGCLNLICEG